jgi:hypothetical protein
MHNDRIIVASATALSLCLSVYLALALYAEHLQSVGLNPFG